ncbi:MAG: hypothetical protein B6U78_00205 [Candidatus Aenigmarchaeota archaeon ex4484_224]|nr:MAG: hypothetical protein B6U78_00205 [Candidatus Aenigmarchaeota archaeon ex4484_224]
MKLRIALDFDETLVDFNLAFINYFNKRFGIGITREDIKDWMFKSLEEKFGIDHKKVQKEFVSFYRKVWNSNFEILKPTFDEDLSKMTFFLKEISEKLDIVTLNPFVDKIRKWLEMNSIFYDEIVWVDTWEEKFNLNYNVFIDDSPILAEIFLKEKPRNKFLILIEKAWNRNFEENEFIKKARNFKEIVEYCIGLKVFDKFERLSKIKNWEEKLKNF